MSDLLCTDHSSNWEILNYGVVWGQRWFFYQSQFKHCRFQSKNTLQNSLATFPFQWLGFTSSALTIYRYSFQTLMWWNYLDTSRFPLDVTSFGLPSSPPIQQLQCLARPRTTNLTVHSALHPSSRWTRYQSVHWPQILIFAHSMSHFSFSFNPTITPSPQQHPVFSHGCMSKVCLSFQLAHKNNHVCRVRFSLFGVLLRVHVGSVAHAEFQSTFGQFDSIFNATLGVRNIPA